MILRILTAGLVACAVAPAAAQIVNTPQCRRDLATADRMVHGIRLREAQFVPGDMATNCRLLRRNLADMIAARDPMDRCLTGHDHGETVAQMDASIEDIRGAIDRHCVR